MASILWKTSESLIKSSNSQAKRGTNVGPNEIYMNCIVMANDLMPSLRTAIHCRQ